MIVKVLDKEYTLLAEWDNIPLSTFQKVCAVPVPKKLKDKWQAWIDGKDAPEESYKDIVKAFPLYYGKIIEILSDIPKEVVSRIEWSLRDRLFNDYLLKIAVSSVFLPQYEPVHPKSFRYKGEEFFFPESLEYGGVHTPMAKETIGTFSESADVNIALLEWGEKGIDAMAQVCAVYLRKEGEEHSDELVIQRTEQFKGLPMSVVWEVFFYILMYGLRLENGILMYSNKVIQELSEQLKLQDLQTLVSGV